MSYADYYDILGECVNLEKSCIGSDDLFQWSTMHNRINREVKGESMREKYESLSLATLKDLAKTRGIKGVSTMKKSEIVEAMLAEDKIDEAKKAANQLKEQGKTVVVVHHDLDTVPEYFNWVLLLNVKVIAFGPMASTFTTENLKKAYGSKHSFAYLLKNPEK